MSDKSQTDTADLKPCPFCGEKATVSGCGYDGAADVHAIYVTCDECGAQGGAVLVERHDPDSRAESEAVTEAAAIWNQRAS